MNSTDRLTAWCLAMAIAAVLVFIRLDNIHDETMQQIKHERSDMELDFKLGMEQAKAEQMKYRALEIGYMCAFSDKDGNVYYSGECE